MYLYFLIDPRTDAIRYVGQTTSARLRLIAHQSHGRQLLCGKKDCVTALDSWLLDLTRAGLSPKMNIHQNVDCPRDRRDCKCGSYCKKAYLAEQELINKIRKEYNADLLNETEYRQDGDKMKHIKKV